MGTDLYPVGNHNIKFKRRTFDDLTQEIKYKLDNANFSNLPFLEKYALQHNEYRNQITGKKNQITFKQQWNFCKEDEYYQFAKDKKLEFYGLFDSELTITKHTLIFWYPPMRYYTWFETEDTLYRNEWRKHYAEVVRLLGGNRLIYLADNAHALDPFLEMDNIRFETLERRLLKTFGKPKQSFKEVAADFDTSYYIDYFDDIDWSVNFVPDE